jgi:organic hydroperoxide reductase OsmC/OhrA
VSITAARRISFCDRRVIMNSTLTTARPRPKSFTYQTALDHVRGRSALLQSEGKPALVVNAPPEFKGEAGYWTPEDLLVASVEVCLMLTFVGFAEKSGVPFVSYTSTAEGLLEWVEESYRFTRVTVRPSIVVADAEGVAKVKKVLERAHQTCLVANSIRSSVIVEPTVAVGQATGGLS